MQRDLLRCACKQRETERVEERAREREMLPRSLLTCFQWISMGEHESVIRIVVVTLSGCCHFQCQPNWVQCRQGHSFIVLSRERDRDSCVCQSERQDQHECQTVAESIKFSLSRWARSMAPYGVVPPSTVPRLHSASGHPLQLLLLVCPQLICSRIIMVCPSQVPTLSSSIIFFFFRYWFIFALSWFSSALGRSRSRGRDACSTASV